MPKILSIIEREILVLLALRTTLVDAKRASQ